jgi:hypothetical protein
LKIVENIDFHLQSFHVPDGVYIAKLDFFGGSHLLKKPETHSSGELAFVSNILELSKMQELEFTELEKNKR